MVSIPEDYIINGLVSGDSLKSAASERSKKIESKSVSSEEKILETRWLSKGWVKQKKLKSGDVKITKEKEAWVQFENQVWTLFYKMGFEELNGRSSTFEILRYDTGRSKQIDVFARNENTICIVECKYSETPHTLSTYKKEIHEAIDGIASMQKSDRLDVSIFKHYNKDGKRNTYKLVWMLALKNIDLSEKDKESAKNNNIYILDDATISYYEQLAKQFGKTSKYMFLGNYMTNKKIAGQETIVPAIQGKMGKYVFYSFAVAPEKLLRISYLAHRGNTQLPPIDTYQRIAKKSRMDKIATYIKEGSKDGNSCIFPTSVVINFSSCKVKFDPAERQKNPLSKIGYLHLPNEYNSAWIIDGQHRLYAYSNLDEEAKTALLPIIAFENLPEAQQAKMFVDINGKQEKVESTLLNEIKANILKNSSKGIDRLDAIYSQITIDLNFDRNSVFYDKIIEANISTRSFTKNITNTTFVSELKNSKLIGKYNPKNPKDFEQGLLFIGEEETCQYVKNIINDYYKLYLKNLTIMEQWNIGSGDGGFLCTNHGIKSTLRLMTYIIQDINGNLNKEGIGNGVRSLSESDLIEKIEPYLQPVIEFISTAPKNELLQMRQTTGESGITSTSDHFVMLINNMYNDFQTSRAQEYREKHSQENRFRNVEGKKIGQRIEEIIRDNVVHTLKEKYGENLSDWWMNGIPNKIRVKILTESDNVGDTSQNYEKYLNFSSLREIIYKNTELFGSQYIIHAKSKDTKNKQLEWLSKCSQLKDLYSLEDGEIISDEDLEYLKDIENEVINKLNQTKF